MITEKNNCRKISAMYDYDIIIVGGGPAGFFASLAARENRPEYRILILEKGSQPLSKVRISGGGRCNITHACYDPAALVTYYPRGSKELRGPFTRFQPRDTVAWFEEHCIRLKTEADGRIFPVTDRSETIVDCLLSEAQQKDIHLHTRRGVKSIIPTGEGFSLMTTDAGALTAYKVLLAAGGGSQSAYRMATDLGHSIVPPVASLFTFNISDARLEGLAGISLPEVEVSLFHNTRASAKKSGQISAKGALLITHWGLSGPAVLSLSSWGARQLAECGYQAELRINWLPPNTPESMFHLMQKVKENHPRQYANKQDPSGRLPARLWQRLVSAAGIGPTQAWNEISNKLLRQLADELTRGEYFIHGKGVFKEEFVTCGGVLLKEVNFKTMESRLRPGLHFAGEILDIDGLTGGFNFQAAWTTGWLAGQGMAKEKG